MKEIKVSVIYADNESKDKCGDLGEILEGYFKGKDLTVQKAETHADSVVLMVSTKGEQSEKKEDEPSQEKPYSAREAEEQMKDKLKANLYR